MRTALPGELYEIFALPGVLYENLALITGHCMEYTLACIWCYYYDDGLECPIILVPWVTTTDRLHCTYFNFNLQLANRAGLTKKPYALEYC